jgi:3-methylfumaryl-CoA hydratase
MIERTELLVPGPAEGLAALLGVPLPDFDAGAGLPLLWHWIYLLERPAQSDLGPDGHPARGGIPTPPEPGRRRMWAGGRVRTDGRLQVGRPATRRTSVAAVEEKTGRSGRLTFVTVSHQVEQDSVVVVDEEQDIVYRDAVPAASAPVPSTSLPTDSEPPSPGEWPIETSPVLLFRFSALTYNGHRIHYDREYARTVEGYPGLVVHGPLQALAMAEVARRRPDVTGQGSLFEYRLLSPLFDHQGLIAGAQPDGDGGIITTVRDRTGRPTASGTLRPD